MGNGRWLAGRLGRDAERQSVKRRSAEKSLEGSGSSGARMRALGAMLVLLLAGSALLGSGFCRAALKSVDQLSAASTLSASRSSLPSKSSSSRLTPLQAKAAKTKADAIAAATAVGKTITIDGTYDSYTPKPIMITMTNGAVVLPKAATPKPAVRHAAAKK